MNSPAAPSTAKNKEKYFDYNATHPLLPRVIESMQKALLEESQNIYGNASSIHAAGRRSKKLMNSLKMELQNFLDAPTGEWIIYSGATEAINAVLCTAECEGWDVLSSSVEHSAVYETLGCGSGQRLMLPVERTGRLNLELVPAILAALPASEKPLLFSLQAHNNETGLCVGCPEVLKSLRKMAEGLGRKIFILLDGVQSLGKAEPAMMTELMSHSDYVVFSGHKMGAMMGVGAMWKRSSQALKSYPTGGGQERGLRAGTEPIWNVISWIEAIKDWQENGNQYRDHMKKLKSIFLEEVKNLPSIEIVEGADSSATLPNTVAVLALEKGSDFVMQKLDIEGFLVSGGSACRSGVTKPSHVMQALGYDEEISKGLIRISFGALTTQEELLDLVGILKEI